MSVEEYLEDIKQRKSKQTVKEYLQYKHLEFEIFHGKRSLTKHLGNKFYGTDLTSIPNYKSVDVEPDIAGIVLNAKTQRKQRTTHPRSTRLKPCLRHCKTV